MGQFLGPETGREILDAFSIYLLYFIEISESKKTEFIDQKCLRLAIRYEKISDVIPNKKAKLFYSHSIIISKG
jgi:hypothetical protein